MSHTAIPTIVPRWPAPAAVQALATTRTGGVSEGVYASLNLGRYCGDEWTAVSANRARLSAQLPAPPLWLRQVHGTRLVSAEQALDEGMDECRADGLWSDRPGTVLAIQTADCLPLLICQRQGHWVAALHAGWRGLAAGLIPRSIAALPGAADNMMAWLGPAISVAHYRVGAEVYCAFVDAEPALAAAFRALDDGWYADLYAIARWQLQRCGLSAVYGGDDCTFSDSGRFFSYRRDRATGRQASCIWLQEPKL